jgi:LmbE family N-acetylglucosaminyl deacetylase
MRIMKIIPSFSFNAGVVATVKPSEASPQTEDRRPKTEGGRLICLPRILQFKDPSVATPPARLPLPPVCHAGIKRLGWAMMGLMMVALLGFLSAPAAAAAAPSRVLRIICFGAHPDDCEIKAGGVAAMYAAKGHKVKFVSVTNGDIGHWREAGGPLALRRKAEVEQAAAVLGIETEVLDIHDGELLPTLENRRTLTRLIREWQADIVMSHRPNDYHPDHRYVGILVQDAAYMVTVPFFCPDVPALKANPIFFYYRDDFKKPNPFQADVVVGIDGVIEKKLEVMDILESQFYEGGANGSAALVPTEPALKAARKKEVRDAFTRRFRSWADSHREQLKTLYGEDRGTGLRFAEAFEVCEYGRRPSPAELKQLFPFFD